MTERKDDRQLRLAGPGDWPSERLVELSTNVMTGPEFTDSVKLIDEAIGESLPQGSLFAYLFRRFGFPNTGSDDFKELCRYYITTTHPDMIMSIVPYSGGDSSISIKFMVPHETRAACDEWYQRSRNARQERFMAWIEEQGRVPEWADRFLAGLKEQGWPVPTEDSGWKRIMPALGMLSALRENSSRIVETPEETSWHEGVKRDYAKIETEGDPGVDYRDPDWQNWDEDDPMKPYAEAIHYTLQDLRRPVWIRDCAIDPWGPCEEPDEEEDTEEEEEEGKVLSSADYAEVAGYPCGALGNFDPIGYCRLQDAIIEEGAGDPVKGIAAVQSILDVRRKDEGQND